MSIFTRARNAVTGVAKDVVGALPAVAGGAVAAQTVLPTAGLMGLLGMGAPIPPPNGGNQGGGYSPQQEDFGPQQNLAGLMNMIGQQQPTVSMTGNSIGGGGLI